MQNSSTAKEVKLSELLLKQSLSPRNFKTVSIPRTQTARLDTFLSEGNPYKKGIEPGSFAYVPHSEIGFIRNSCITPIDFSVNKRKAIFLNPNYGYENTLKELDVLLCKDANIGDTGLICESDTSKWVFSSGLVRLNFINEKYKFYCLAFLKDSYFLEQLDAITPKGATIRHAGDRFLSCLIPQLREEEEWVLEIIESLLKNITFAENSCEKKFRWSEQALASELLRFNINYELPLASKLILEKRLDAGFYSKQVGEVLGNVAQYPGGSESLESFGFELKRGPNLAKRDLGRSIQAEHFQPGYKLLVYPSDISDSGYIERVSYIGARNRMWTLSRGDILFSAEGTVGKIFVVCDSSLEFTTNFHGMIITPQNKEVGLEKSTFVGLYLNFLRAFGVLERLSVGGQGGSFAQGYWGLIRIPILPERLTKEFHTLYNNDVGLDPFTFNLAKLGQAGIYQLSNFRTLCKETLSVIIEDIKIDRVGTRESYESRFKF